MLIWKMYFIVLAICLCLVAQEPPIATPQQPHADTPQPITSPQDTRLPQTHPYLSPQTLNLSAMREVPIQHRGRIQPLETFARLLLCQFSGRTTVATPEGRLSALQWLTLVLWEPQRAKTYKIFLIENPQILDHIHISYEKARDRYSYQDLEPGLERLAVFVHIISQRPQEQQTKLEQQMIHLLNNVNDFQSLMNTFSFLHPDFLPTSEWKQSSQPLGSSTPPAIPSSWQESMTAYDYLLFLRQLESATSTSQLTINNPKVEYLWQIWQTQKKQNEASAQAWLDQIKQSLIRLPHPIQGGDFRIFPYQPHWYSPWEVLLQPQNENTKLLEYWGRIAQSYYNNNAEQFQAQLMEYNQQIAHQLGDPNVYRKVQLEAHYYAGDWLFWAKILYIISLLICSLSWLGHANRKMVTLASGILALGFLLTMYALILRMLIKGRPPIANLYETMVFVAWFSVGMALFLEMIFHKLIPSLSIFSGGVVGTLLLLMSDKFAYESDTLGVLVAVLDSNFWLSTHVTTIIIGYASCFIAGALAHLFIVVQLISPQNIKNYNLALSRMMYGTLCFATLFIFLGTVLGGFWADQSWGRFWGWDPKENGALVLLLWNAVLLHARASGYLKEWGIALCAIFGNLVVAGAWWGVNLLNVGLHSYGFSQSIRDRLLYFVGVELLFLLLGSILMVYRTEIPTASRSISSTKDSHGS